MNAQPYLTIDDSLRIADVDNDDSPLAHIKWSNQWQARWSNLSDAERMRLGAAIRDAIVMADVS